MKTGNEPRAAVEEWLTDWFVSRAKIGNRSRKEASEVPRDAARDTDYFDAGWLTSMEVVEFVTDIEQHFSMQFSDRDLQDRRFVTIAGLAELVLAHSIEASQNR